MILNQAQDQMLILIAGDITHGQWGTSTATLLVTNTALTTAHAETNTALELNIVSGEVVATVHNIIAVSAVNIRLAEYALKTGASGTTYNRILFNDFLKASEKVITIVTLAPRLVD